MITNNPLFDFLIVVGVILILSKGINNWLWSGNMVDSKTTKDNAKKVVNHLIDKKKKQ